MLPSPSETAPVTGRPASRAAVFRLLAWCGVCVALPVLLLRNIQPGDKRVKMPKAHSAAAQEVMDVPKTIAALRAANPDYIGIGNSMLFTRLGTTPEEMNSLTGKKFFFLLKNGSGSAVWYMTLKNVVAASGVKPRLVFFFIRDNDLTSPFFRTAGKYATYLNSLRGPQEPVVDALLKVPPARPGLSGLVARWLTGPDGWLTLPAWDEKFPRQMIDLSMDLGGGGTPKSQLRAILSARFAVSHLRSDMAADLPVSGSGDGYAPDNYSDLNGSYQDAEEHSFLPAMMQVAGEHGLKLLFFRIKRRPDEQGNVSDEPSELRPYAEHLKRWIEERGGLFFDESYDPAIPRSAYQDGDHISKARLEWYQRYFWKRMAPVFP